MKKLIFLFILFLSLKHGQAQEIDYNNLSPSCRDMAKQAFAKVSLKTKQWFAAAVMKHPVGGFDLTWTNQTLRTYFSATDMDQMGSIFAVMMAYQKLMNKEAREDRKQSIADQRLELKEKDAKLDQEKTKIEQQKIEAAERYDNAMNSANRQTTIGVVSANTQIATNTTSTSDKQVSSTVIQDSLKRLQGIKAIAKPGPTSGNNPKVSVKQIQDQLAILKTRTNL